MRRLILASASPRRRELLATLGVPYEIAASAFDEDSVPTVSLTPAQWVMRLAEGKARDVAAHVAEATVIIGADTTVILDGDYLNKPADAPHARAMLRRLSGRAHQVYTGVCVLDAQDGRPHTVRTDFAMTEVTFDELSDTVIDAYVATGEPLDKAGAYGIQGHALSFIPTVHGDYFNVVGFPLSLVRKMLLPHFPDMADAPPQPAFPSASYGTNPFG